MTTNNPKSAHTVMRSVLRHLVSLKRRHGSNAECGVVPYLMRSIASSRVIIDGAGNLHVDCRTDKTHRTLFVGHTDTVHREGGKNLYRETPKGLYAVDACLGADDAAGVSIMAAMIGRVPGYYIFTRGEECGGIGSKHLAENHSRLLLQFDRAIALDRKGTSDVITHQWSGRCCSDEFAYALADALNDTGLMYMPSDAGVYTDTAEFVDLIPECTNLSTGYYSEHSKNEWLDIEHHAALLDAALTIKWDSLPTRRDPEEIPLDDEFPMILHAGDDVVHAAVWKAIGGKPSDLKQLLAENICPDDPKAALSHIDMRALMPDAVIEAASTQGDWGMVIEYLAGEAFVQL